MKSMEQGKNLPDWISITDHDVASATVAGSTFDYGDPNVSLTSLKIEQFKQDPETYHDLMTIGLHLIPLDHNGAISEDKSLYEVYALGVDLALASLDALCERLDIDITMFRKAWRANGLVRMIDTTHESISGLTAKEQYAAVAQGIIANGQAVMTRLGPVYEQLTDAVDSVQSDAAANPNILRASYGFVMGGGIAALERILQELEARRLTESLDFESAIDEWAKSSSIVRETHCSMNDVEYAVFAERLDTNAFYGEESIEVYIGKMIERLLDEDERSVEILNALALVMYPNDLSNFSLDETGEAFFHGALLALDAIKQHAAALSLEPMSVTRSWRGQRTHQWLYNTEDVPETRLEHIDKYVFDTLDKPTLAPEYDNVILKLSDELDHDADEAMAFQNGFHYVLLTGSDALRACIRTTISRKVKAETNSLDEELRKLFEA